MAPPAHADTAQSAVIGATGGTVFEICRLPGLGAESPGGVITIPAGSKFLRSPSLVTDAAISDPRSPPVGVVTTQTTSIPADGYCVTVPVMPFGHTDAREFGAAVGEMFVPTDDRRHAVGLEPLDLTYGLLKSFAARTMP